MIAIVYHRNYYPKCCLVKLADNTAMESLVDIEDFSGRLECTYKLTINVPVVYMGRYKVVLRGDYP